MTECPDCGSPRMERSNETVIFPYGSGRDAVRLKALVPVSACLSCGCQVTGDEAAARHTAVMRFLIAERDKAWPRLRSSGRRRRLRLRWLAVTVYLRSGRTSPTFRKALHG